MVKHTNKKTSKWKQRLLAAAAVAAVGGSIAGGIVYWEFFRKDPAFVEQKRQSDQLQGALDDVFAEHQFDETKPTN